MQMECITTPGHGIVTDSLIMHGIVKVLGEKIEKIIRNGERYLICGEFENIDSPFLELLKEELELSIIEVKGQRKSSRGEEGQSKEELGLNFDVIRASEYLSKIRDSNINNSVLRTWLSSLKESIGILQTENISKIYNCSHKENYDEGERKRKGKFIKRQTLYLPLGYIFGKYRVENKHVKTKEYQVCYYCFALSNIGLLSGVILQNSKIKTEKTQNEVKTFIALIPNNEITGRDAILLQRFTEGKSVNFKVEMTIPASLLYSLSIGETTYLFNNEVIALVWRLEKSGNFQRALQPMLININNVLNKIATIKASYPYFVKLLDSMVKEGEIAIMTELARYLIYGTEDVYKVIRDISMFVSKKKLKVGSVKNLAEVLLSFQ